MRTFCVKNGLVMGVILLFIGVTLSPVATAVYNDIGNDEPINNSDEIGKTDDYEEIITWISGNAHCSWNKRRGIFRGELKLSFCTWCSGVNIFGLRRSDSGVELYWRNKLRIAVNIPRFIGLATPNLSVLGIAVGNIEFYHNP